LRGFWQIARALISDKNKNVKYVENKKTE